MYLGAKPVLSISFPGLDKPLILSAAHEDATPLIHKSYTGRKTALGEKRQELWITNASVFGSE